MTDAQPTAEERSTEVTTLPAEQHVWLAAWCAVAGCWNTKSKEVCASWADRCLDDFRQRFKR